MSAWKADALPLGYTRAANILSAFTGQVISQQFVQQLDKQVGFTRVHSICGIYIRGIDHAHTAEDLVDQWTSKNAKQTGTSPSCAEFAQRMSSSGVTSPLYTHMMMTPSFFTIRLNLVLLSSTGVICL
jgi:hypothetical protein